MGNIVDVQPNWAEDVVKFLHNPVVSSILIMVGVFGLFAEIKHPGFGLPGSCRNCCSAAFLWFILYS